MIVKLIRYVQGHVINKEYFHKIHLPHRKWTIPKIHIANLHYSRFLLCLFSRAGCATCQPWCSYSITLISICMCPLFPIWHLEKVRGVFEKKKKTSLGEVQRNSKWDVEDVILRRSFPQSEISQIKITSLACLIQNHEAISNQQNTWEVMQKSRSYKDDL